MGEETILITLAEYRQLQRERAAGMRAWARLTAARESDRTRKDYKQMLESVADGLNEVFGVW